MTIIYLCDSFNMLHLCVFFVRTQMSHFFRLLPPYGGSNFSP
nr:MAG TPA: hypothetical protein [Caudoviricetes sp.]